MILEEKVKEAKNLIERFVVAPVVLSSFGKDSMVLLDLIKKTNKKYPIIFWKEPFLPKKYSFANKIILDNDYTVYDYPPLETTVTKEGENFEIINYYQIGNNPIETIYLPTGIVSPISSEEYLCGLEDIYNKPKGTFNFPWATIFLGHKNSDIDLILGSVKLKENYFTHNNKTFVYPIKAFTDQDIWEYTEKENLPINSLRYNKDNNWKEFSDYTYNPDYFPVCISCMDKDNKAQVLCPKTNKLIPNISKELVDIRPNLSHYLELVG